jgi:hypothetical protein
LWQRCHPDLHLPTRSDQCTALRLPATHVTSSITPTITLPTPTKQATTKALQVASSLPLPSPTLTKASKAMQVPTTIATTSIP